MNQRSSRILGSATYLDLCWLPLRAIRQLGAGSDFPDADNKTRAARTENGRVDVKIYSLDLTGQPTQCSLQ